MVEWIIAGAGGLLGLAGVAGALYYRFRSRAAEKLADAQGAALKVMGATNSLLRNEIAKALETVISRQAAERSADEKAATAARADAGAAAGFLRTSGSPDRPAAPGVPGGTPAAPAGPVVRRPLPQ